MSGTFRSWFGGKKDAPETPESAPRAPEANPPPANGPIDFVAVLTAAGIETEARERVVKAKQLLAKMPPDAGSATKRQIVEAAFQAFEIPTQKIVDGASAEIAALRAHIQIGEEEKKAKLAGGERRIAELEAEIRDVRAAMDLAVAAQERRQRLTLDEIATVEPIVHFFAQAAKGDAAGEVDPLAEPDIDVAPDGGAAADSM